MYVMECVTHEGLARILKEGWRALREEDPPGLPPDSAVEAWKRQLVNDLLQVNYGERDPSTGQLTGYCYPYDQPAALLSPHELRQRRLRWTLQPAQAQFPGGMSILVYDGRVQVRLPLQQGAADDPDFWRRVWTCLHVLAEAKLHVYDIQIEHALDLQHDQGIVRQKYNAVVEDVFGEDEEEVGPEADRKGASRRHRRRRW
jgi:hypothetical protein